MEQLDHCQSSWQPTLHLIVKFHHQRESLSTDLTLLLIDIDDPCEVSIPKVGVLYGPVCRRLVTTKHESMERSGAQEFSLTGCFAHQNAALENIV